MGVHNIHVQMMEDIHIEDRTQNPDPDHGCSYQAGKSVFLYVGVYQEDDSNRVMGQPLEVLVLEPNVKNHTHQDLARSKIVRELRCQFCEYHRHEGLRAVGICEQCRRNQAPHLDLGVVFLD